MNSIILAPTPKRVVFRSGTYQIDRSFAERVNAYTRGIPISDIIRLSNGGAADAGLTNDEAYRLSISVRGVAIESRSDVGVYRAVTTLRQLILQAPALLLPAVEIDDSPDMANRGIMLDVSRDRVPTMETLFALIDFFSEVKVNHLELYFEHTFAYGGHETVWRNASPFTEAEIRQLDDYCHARYIDLVPNQNSFGHMERWLKHPEYRYLAEAPDGWRRPEGTFVRLPYGLSPTVPETLSFLSGLYDQLLPNFRSRMLNVGLDETLDLGQGRSKERCDSIGVGRVYLDFINAIHRIAAERGKTMLFWGDIILHYPELISELPDGAVAMTWGYEGDHPFEQECEKFQHAGVPFYVCPGTSAWNSIGGRWENARTNLERAADAANTFGADGILVTEWGDYGHWQQYPIGFPGLLYGSALAWSRTRSRGLDVERALSRLVFDDESGALSRSLLSLGEIYLEYRERIHNASPAFAALLDTSHPIYPTQLPKFLDAPFGRVAERADGAAKLAATARPKRHGGSLLTDELIFSARYLRFGNSLLEARANATNTAQRAAGQLAAVEEIAKARRAELRIELDGLEAQYTDLWSRRSRPGGLSDSTGRMRWLAGRLA